MNIEELIAKVGERMSGKLDERHTHHTVITDIRSACAAENRDPSEDEATKVRAADTAIRAIDAELDELQARKTELEDEKRRDDAAAALAREVHPGAARAGGTTEQRAEVREPRTYSREADPKGIQFLRDVVMSSMGTSPQASERLSRHMVEEHTEREAVGAPLRDRAAGTGAFSGLVVPQYLIDQFAPAAKAGRPFADACRPHDLPETGMTVNIGRVTTQTSTGLQETENSNVSEQDIDDTLLTIPVQTNAGQQTLSRQGIERGAGVEDTTMQDLLGSYHTTLDSTLLNQSVTGLAAVAASNSYTDATPTAAELYPKLLQAPAAVEAALLNQMAGDTLAVMHSRRWYWLQSQLTSTWPMFGQPSVPSQLGGVNYGEKYGQGVRGVLPNGTPVIVDNNIATNRGAGTNEDEIYFGAQSELHLWEDPNAPVMIRADQTKAASLGILLVVYGYFAYTFQRRSHAQKVNGTGLLTPTF